MRDWTPWADQDMGKLCTWVQFHREGRQISGMRGSEKLVRASGDVVSNGDTGVWRSQELGLNSPLLTSQGTVTLSLGHTLLFLVSEGEGVSGWVFPLWAWWGPS